VREQKYLRKIDAAHLWHPFTQMCELERQGSKIIVKGKGSIVWDIEGNKYIDASGSLSANIVGHGRQEMLDAIVSQMKRLVVSQKVEGIILNPVTPTEDFVKRIVSSHKIPLVAIDNKVNNVKTDVVLHNDVSGTQKLTSHLVTHGHRRIAFIGGPLHETSGKERLEGYKKALAKNGLPIQERLIKVGDWTKDSGFQLTKELLEASKRPTAIVAANAFVALGVIFALREEGLKVATDVALVSFDDYEFCAALESPLTTLKSAGARMGEVAAHLLLKRITNNNRGKMEEIHLPVELMIRNSCGCKSFGNRGERG